MNLTDNIIYKLINYQKYKKRINDILNDDKMQALSISYNSLGKTTYDYDIDLITIGRGDKHLFVVGGTHGSEIISVDFVTQLIYEIKNIYSFDPNEFTIYFIPLQNPEGFEITTSSLKKLDDNNLENRSKEYYLRYKTDNLISKALVDMNSFINCYSGQNYNIFIEQFKKFLNTNNSIKLLQDDMLLKNLHEFIKEINNICEVSEYDEFKIKILSICEKLINKYSKNDNINDQMLSYFISILFKYFSNNDVWDNIKNNELRLHQRMFRDVGFSNIQNQKLRNSIIKMYDKYNHPSGSQVTYDSTGLGVNLNANTMTNPGIEIMKSNYIKYRQGARDNIVSYVPGPIGMPYFGKVFNYSCENIVLYNLIKNSYENGNYIGCLLYHSTGGCIYWEPYYNNSINEDKYKKFYEINKKMGMIYQQSTGYKIEMGAENTGYGDLLMKTFPGVLLIELSKMGGNPISAYGDKDNIRRCFTENYEAFSNLLSYLICDNNKSKKLYL